MKCFFIYRNGWTETRRHERFCHSSISIQPSLHLEMIKLYVWRKQSLFNKVFIYIIFTRIVCFLFLYSSLSQWHCWNADYPVVGTVSFLKIYTLCKYLTVTFHWMGVKELRECYIINPSPRQSVAVLFNKWKDILVPVLIPALLSAFP